MGEGVRLGVVGVVGLESRGVGEWEWEEWAWSKPREPKPEGGRRAVRACVRRRVFAVVVVVLCLTGWAWPG